MTTIVENTFLNKAEQIIEEELAVIFQLPISLEAIQEEMKFEKEIIDVFGKLPAFTVQQSVSVKKDGLSTKDSECEMINMEQSANQSIVSENIKVFEETPVIVEGEVFQTIDSNEAETLPIENNHTNQPDISQPEVLKEENHTTQESISFISTEDEVNHTIEEKFIEPEENNDTQVADEPLQTDSEILPLEPLASVETMEQVEAIDCTSESPSDQVSLDKNVQDNKNDVEEKTDPIETETKSEESNEESDSIDYLASNIANKTIRTAVDFNNAIEGHWDLKKGITGKEIQKATKGAQIIVGNTRTLDMDLLKENIKNLLVKAKK